MKFFKNNKLIIIFLLLSTLIGGCATPQSRRATADDLATANALSRAVISTDAFDLVVYHRGLSQSSTLHVYIEGDGRGWRTRTRQSDDPTPTNPVSLQLASKDTNPTVIYIARPCQYLDEERLADCHPKYWSTYRYAEEVITAIDTVITWAQTQQADGERELGLVGYSGGGTVAALVAARRNDVRWLVTIAANLDHQYWAEYHGDTPLAQSLNPPDFRDALIDLPQLHLVGSDDEKVPKVVVNRYIDRLALSEDEVLLEVEGFDHGCCWQELWPARLCEWQPTAC